MNRREMLKYTALLTGGALSASFTTAFLSGCTRLAEDSAGLHYFDASQFELVSLLADTILPRTDSPSATDVNVHHTIDSMIGLVFDEEFKTTFKDHWAELENNLSEHGFQKMDQDGRVELLRSLELDRAPETDNARHAYTELKQQTITYYMSTEVIGKEHLNYLPIPGEYKPCIPVEDVGNRAWAI